MITICKRCKYGTDKRDRDAAPYIRECDNPDSPVTDFVNGYKIMADLNKDGHCPWYKDRRKGG